jgi:hypothetical protein
MQTHQIKVINNNNFPVTDFCDGLAYHFNPANPKGINLSVDAARHIFGVDFPADLAGCEDEALREEVWHHLQKRWGWNSHDAAKLAENYKKFKKLEFKPVVFTITEVISGGENEDPAPPRAKTTDQRRAAFKPRADEEGASTEEEVA